MVLSLSSTTGAIGDIKTLALTLTGPSPRVICESHSSLTQISSGQCSPTSSRRSLEAKGRRTPNVRREMPNSEPCTQTLFPFLMHCPRSISCCPPLTPRSSLHHHSPTTAYGTPRHGPLISSMMSRVWRYGDVGCGAREH